MDPQQLQQFELLCVQAQTGVGDARSQAEQALSVFNVAAERIPQLQYVLEHSVQPFAQHFASLALSKLITTFWNNFTTAQRLEIRNYALSFIASRGTSVRVAGLRG